MHCDRRKEYEASFISSRNPGKSNHAKAIPAAPESLDISDVSDASSPDAAGGSNVSDACDICEDYWRLACMAWIDW
jgi:hypothetical protein